jgi:hypothetical protein
MKVLITESQYKSLILEHFDSERLYDREHIVKRLMKGPRQIKEYIKRLPHIPCSDSEGNERVCTKIPEVIYVYLSGNY